MVNILVIDQLFKTRNFISVSFSHKKQNRSSELSYDDNMRKKKNLSTSSNPHVTMLLLNRCDPQIWVTLAMETSVL